jgi:hypothetical protein
MLVVLLCACGGGDDAGDELPDTVQDLTTTSAPEGRAFADWQAASRFICNQYNPKLEAAAANVIELVETDVEAAFAEYSRLIELILEYVDELRSIPVPTERKRPVEAINDMLDRGAKSVAAVHRNVEMGDFSGFISQRGILLNYADTDPLYRDLDVPECAAPEE